MDERLLCMAPRLCIRCRSSSYGLLLHDVVSNADACTCPDDETCSHNKNAKKKKTNSQSTIIYRVWGDNIMSTGTCGHLQEYDNEDEWSSSSSSSSNMSSSSSSDSESESS